MILNDISNMAGWWSVLITLKVILASAYFFFAKKPKKYDPHNDALATGNYKPWKTVPLIEHDVIVEESPIMSKIDDNCLNVGATSFLCFDKEESIMESAIKCLHKYGVGSCGPRGFYGTIDVHLELEERLAKFLEVEETCVYSYGFSTIASAIPAYAKKQDIIFADEKVWFAIQKGFDAARSTVRYYKHNDMQDLEKLLAEAKDKKQLSARRRAFLVTEAVFFNTGEMCPLREAVVLARRYKLRIILDESLSIGVLGKNGRGLTEHLDVPRDEVDLIVGSLEHSFASVGGFCAGSHFIVEHQRLSGLGYCFSASLPPMLTQAAISGLDILETRPEILAELEESSKKLDKALSNLQHFTVRGHALSPVKHVYLKKEVADRLQHSYLQHIAGYCLARGVALAAAAAAHLRDPARSGPAPPPPPPPPSLRVAASRKLDDRNIARLCSLLDEAYEAVPNCVVR